MSRGVCILALLLTGCAPEAAPPARPPAKPLGAPAISAQPGPPVTIIDFDDRGRMVGPVSVPQIQLPESEWQARLGGLAFGVLRRKNTEFAFTGAYNKHYEPGIYRCAGCNTALFHSETKFDSHTGWPSFTAPIAGENVYTTVDSSLGVSRDEVLCRRCDGHLGHVFPDGPQPSGMRYCINSAALRFQPTSSEESNP